MKQPESFICKTRRSFSVNWKRAFSGLKQSLHCWNVTLDSSRKEFQQSVSDPCIYFKRKKKILFTWEESIDDIILAGKTERNSK